jgi:TPR repeat protein
MRKTIVSITLILALAAPLAHAGYDEGLSDFRAGNYGMALNELIPAAKAGNADAQQLLGHMYYMGQGVPQDFKQALNWHRKAAVQGKHESEYVIGTMYYSGKGVEQDYKGAMQWLQKAASGGHADAQYMLGAMYFTGKGVPQDYQQSVAWFRRAAEQSQSEAQRLLGLMHLHGVGGVPKDNVIAYMLWNLSAAAGNMEASDLRNDLAQDMTPRQLEEGQRLSSRWQPHTPLPTHSSTGN